MGTHENQREPCPDRIIDDVGGAFSMGVVGGSAFHFLKGVYRSPYGERLLGGTQAVRMNAPRVGGSFGVWGGLFSTFDCSLVYLRQKEDPWNSVISGAGAAGLLQMRQGMFAASRSAVIGGLFLAMIEGTGIMVNKILTAQPEAPIFLEDLPGSGIPQEPSPSSSASSPSYWFRGLFGNGTEEAKTSGGAKTEILESFDAPIPPTFEFK